MLSRVEQSAIDRDLFERMTRNDPATARAVAFDRALLARACARAAPSVGYRVENADGAVARARADGAAVQIRIEMPEPCLVRLDRLLCGELGLSRSRLQRHATRGDIATVSGRGEGLPRRVCDGMLISLAAAVLQA